MRKTDANEGVERRADSIRGASPRSALASVDVPLDPNLYHRIVEDMEREAGMHAPAEMWRPAALFPDSAPKQDSPTFGDLIAPWIGAAAEEIASEEDVARCFAFLESHGARRWVGKLPSLPTKSDLRTMLDVALILQYARPHETLCVLEVGGGYGRLAEAFLCLEGLNMKYLMVDAVPASIYYAYTYLDERLPDRSIGLYYLDETPDLSQYDCYVAPTWHLDQLDLPTADVAINIASMQEMTLAQVRYYLALFNRVTRPGGVIYLSNTRDYAYGHEYEYPRNWRLLLKTNTPMSWSPHYPVEIFARTDDDWSLENAVQEAGYLKGVCAAYRQRIRESTEATAERSGRLQEALASQRAANDRLKQANERLRSMLATKTKALAAQRAANERLKQANERPRSARRK